MFARTSEFVAAGLSSWFILAMFFIFMLLLGIAVSFPGGTLAIRLSDVGVCLPGAPFVCCCVKLHLLALLEPP